MSDTPTDPRHDPDYQWPTEGGPHQSDLAAAIEHMKAWFRREFGQPASVATGPDNGGSVIQPPAADPDRAEATSDTLPTAGEFVQQSTITPPGA